MGSIGSGDGFGVGSLQIAGKFAIVSTNGFYNLYGLLVKDNGEFEILFGQCKSQIMQGNSLKWTPKTGQGVKL
jgi:hypothetical protein